MKKIDRVFCIVPDCHDANSRYAGLWDAHFYRGVAAAVTSFKKPTGLDFSWGRSGQNNFPSDSVEARRRTSEELLKQVISMSNTHGIDVVLSYCFAGDLELEVVHEVVRRGIPWVNFFCDSTHRFHEVEPLAKVVSLNWFPEHDAIGAYQQLGNPIVCLPYALNPALLPDLSTSTPNHEVGFAGVPSTNRITQLGILKLMGVNTTIRGYGWVESDADPFQSNLTLLARLQKLVRQRGCGEKLLRRILWPVVRAQAGPALSENEFPKFVQNCRVILGLNQGKDPLGNFGSYLKFRDIEFPGYGCCYLTQHNRDIETAFEVGNEILTYTSLAEAAQIIRRIKNSELECRRIGMAARRKVLAEHTWERRLIQLASLL